MLTLNVERIEPDIHVLKLAGRLGIGSSGQELQWKVEELLAKNEKKVVMDFTDLKYLDSTGLGIVVFCAGKLNESGGELRVAGASPTIRNLFKITRVDKVLHLDDNVANAVANFGKSED
jgi:anti-sigma B factor antagonist